MALLQYRPVRESAAAVRLRDGLRVYRRKLVVPWSVAGGVIDGKHVAVVGGGVAGFVTAAHMVTLGALVDVYTQHAGSGADSVAASEGSSDWPILIGLRANEAMQTAGLALAGLGALQTCDSAAAHT